jgi:AraC-like DNA-binding protein
MKIQLENILPISDRSFTMMFNPRLSDLFFWHFHPEFELVYIEAASGPRHVGDHISTFTYDSLVLIGSNIPHLNFDYGIKTQYRKVVVHLKKELVENHFQPIPELSVIDHLFQRSQYGLSFEGPLKKKIGAQLFELKNMNPMDQYQRLIQVLKLLATTDNVVPLHPQPYHHKYSDKEQGRLRTIYAFVDQYFQNKIELKQIADLSNMSKEAFCRYFKKATQYTFIEFLNRYRISQSKRLLMSGKSVGDACYGSGFESLSYYNRIFKKITNENPSTFKKRY